MPRKRARRAKRPNDRSLATALASPACYGPGVKKVRLVETHISWVFLTGRHAYKVKKPVKLPFVDFSTLARRKRFCGEELRLNRRLAAELYLDVVPIGGTLSAPRVGRRPALEYAIKMRQFPDDARLDRRLAAHALPKRAVVEFAQTLAEFHRKLPAIAAPLRSAAATRRTVERNVEELAEYASGPDRARLDAVRAWTRLASEAAAPVLARRAAAGSHRECHGDLHLENLLLVGPQIASCSCGTPAIHGGRIVAFDALEFDPKLREIDVVSEASFVMMDLLAHDRADLAYGFMSRYLEAGGDYDGLEVLRFYLVYRALVRAKVRAIKAAQHRTKATAMDGGSAATAGRNLRRRRGVLDPYLALATALTQPRKPLLVITHGLSGSGKTHVTDELVGRLPAVRVRSDLERKRLRGLRGEARTASRVGAGLYGPEATAQTYARLAAVAAAALRNGFDAIVDATFLRHAERTQFRALAAALGARFALLDCVAPEAVLRKRIAARRAGGRDASEATGAVLDRQLETHDPLRGPEHAAVVAVDTASAVDYGRLAAALSAR